MANSAHNSLVKRVIGAYGLDCRAILEPQSGYRNTIYPLQLSSGRVINLTFYKTEPGILAKIRAANYVSNHLATQGFPARQTYNQRILVLRSSSKTTYASLYNYLPGDTIPWEAYTQEHIKLLGAAMAEMHGALARLPLPVASSSRTYVPNVYADFQSLISHLQIYFAHPEVQHALQAKLHLCIKPHKLAQLLSLLNLCAALPGQQPLHLDFVRGNVLFGTDQSTGQPAISGILDFEKTALGHPITDVARTLAFLLIDCPKPEAKVRKYFLQSGYAKRGGGQLHHSKLLEPLLDLFLIYDFYKFLRHNPYEYLEQNYHFRRTRNLLLTRGLLE